MNRSRGAAALGLVLVWLGASCASARLPKDMDPESKDFISKVRYIITGEERKAFLALPAGDRKAFIEDFWARRDPNPATPVNEYKEEFYRRIAVANRLFSGGGSPGWLQDRGRVYVTLGPPDNRITYPRGVTFYGVPTEIWLYGFFPIYFIDDRWVDDYRLEPDSAAQIAVISAAQVDWNSPGRKMAGAPAKELAAEVEFSAAKGPAADAVLKVSLPYRMIWLKAEGETLRASLDLSLVVLDKGGTKVWEFAKTYPIEVAAGARKDKLAKDFVAEVTAPLAPGSYTAVIALTNSNGGGRSEIRKDFEI